MPANAAENAETLDRELRGFALCAPWSGRGHSRLKCDVNNSTFRTREARHCCNSACKTVLRERQITCGVTIISPCALFLLTSLVQPSESPRQHLQKAVENPGKNQSRASWTNLGSKKTSCRVSYAILATPHLPIQPPVLLFSTITAQSLSSSTICNNLRYLFPRRFSTRIHSPPPHNGASLC